MVSEGVSSGLRLDTCLRYKVLDFVAAIVEVVRLLIATRRDGKDRVSHTSITMIHGNHVIL